MLPSQIGAPEALFLRVCLSVTLYVPSAAVSTVVTRMSRVDIRRPKRSDLKKIFLSIFYVLTSQQKSILDHLRLLKGGTTQLKASKHLKNVQKCVQKDNFNSHQSSAVGDMPPEHLYKRIRQRPPRNCENNASPTVEPS